MSETIKAEPPITSPFAPKPDPFADAEAALRNALWHTKRFKQAADPKEWLPLLLGNAKDNGDRTCTLFLNRQALIDLKPIIFDVSVNIIHALDLAIAACARKNGHARLKHLYFPIETDDTKFADRLNSFIKESWIDRRHTDAIQSARSHNRHTLEYLATLKEVANSCKHWELAAANGKVFAASITPMNGQKQKNFDIAPDEFMSRGRYDFIWPQGTPTNVPVQIILSLGIEIEINGNVQRFDASSTFDRSQQYVRATVDALKSA